MSNWIYNPAKNSYYQIKTSVNGHSGNGVWHVYRDGTQVFVANPPVASNVGGAVAPANLPTPVAAVTPAAPSVSWQQLQNAPAVSVPVAPVTPVSPDPWQNNVQSVPTVATPATAVTADPWQHNTAITPVTDTPPAPVAPDAWQHNAQTTPASTIGPDAWQHNTAITPVTDTPPAPVAPDAWQHNAQTNPAGTISADAWQHNARLAPANTGGATAPSDLTSGVPHVERISAQPISSTDASKAIVSQEAQHIVVHGDTLSGIAEKNGLKLSHLESLNPQIKTPNLIHPGDIVKLGNVSSQVTENISSTSTFPEKTSYPTGSLSSSHPASDSVKSAVGWAGGGNEAPDPGKIALSDAGKTETDPLNIGKNKK